jgi:hypothetical protein
MKGVVNILILMLPVLVGLSCERTGTSNGPDPWPGAGPQVAAKTSDEQVLLLEDESLLLEDGPLLLDEEEEVEGASGGADNRRCHVCHVNLLEEEIAGRHARAGIGCARCHGECDEHIADESWASGGNGTAPDTMFPRDEILMFCLGCHTPSALTSSQHKGAIGGSSEKVCTDCHGKHRLTTRKCKWK